MTLVFLYIDNKIIQKLPRNIFYYYILITDSLKENYVSISTRLDIICLLFIQMSEFSRRSKYEV
jgi:hypothetical protein